MGTVIPEGPKTSDARTDVRPAFDIQGVRMSFSSKDGPVHALANITFTVGAGEFVSLVGPSGCGKTTLLKIVAGLVRPTSGEVSVGGQPVNGPHGSVGMVFQSPVLMAWRTILSNVMLQVEIRGLDRADYGRRARDLLGLVGLRGFENRYPHELSGGMQQRASICRALIHDPEIIVMDEPFGALDALTREQMNLELQRIWLEKQKTVLFVTHSISEAVFLSDRIVVMSARPARILRILDVPIPRPRTLDMMAEPRFSGLVSAIRHEMEAHGSLD